MIRFLVDAQLPPGLADRLATRGYLAEHVNRMGLGAASDSALWQHAARVRATLVTKDEDFVDLALRDPAYRKSFGFERETSATTCCGACLVHGWTRLLRR